MLDPSLDKYNHLFGHSEDQQLTGQLKQTRAEPRKELNYTTATITTGIFSHLPVKIMWMMTGWAQPHSTIRHFVLLKYLQVLALPFKSGLLLVFGALASFYTALLLNSPHVSRKASSVLLSQLARADGLLLLHWALGALRVTLGVPEEILDQFQEGLLVSHHLASLLLLGCVSLEAMLVCRRPVETRSLRTVSCAHLASSVVWGAVAIEFLVLQVSKYEYELGVQRGVIMLLVKACTFVAPFIQAVSFCIRLVLSLANMWTYYSIFYNKPQRRKSCFH